MERFALTRSGFGAQAQLRVGVPGRIPPLPAARRQGPGRRRPFSAAAAPGRLPGAERNHVPFTLGASRSALPGFCPAGSSLQGVGWVEGERGAERHRPL